jgi:hypothetical protein
MSLSEYITPEMKLWAFRAYLMLRQFAISSWKFGSALSSATYAALQPNDYVFYDGYEVPVQAWKVKSENPGTPKAYWYYNPSTALFFKTSPTGETHRFPFLSASLCFNGMNLYSLDDFLGEQQYVGEQPSPVVLVGAWCLVNGIVLDKNLDFKLHIINEMGEEKYYGPWSLDWSNGALSQNVYTGPSTSGAAKTCIPKGEVKCDCIAADTFENDSIAAYPGSYETTKELRTRKTIYTAEPFISSSTFEAVDLSGSAMKVD